MTKNNKPWKQDKPCVICGKLEHDDAELTHCRMMLVVTPYRNLVGDLK